MLYPFQLIAEHRFALPPQPSGFTPAERVLLIARGLSSMFADAPRALCRPGDAGLTLLYRNVSYLWQDLADSVGALAAGEPVRFCSTTEGRETAEVTFLLQGSELVARLRSVSGKSFGHLQGLAVQFGLPGETAAGIAAIAAADPFLAPCTVVPRAAHPLLAGSRLLAPAHGARFSYLAWGEPLPACRLLEALTTAHKLLLWQEFLRDGLQPAEFDWLWESYYSGEALYLLEWELALRMALDELGFQVERRDARFSVRDAQGRERRFDFARGGVAEKVFLKLLFPLDTK